MKKHFDILTYNTFFSLFLGSFSRVFDSLNPDIACFQEIRAKKFPKFMKSFDKYDYSISDISVSSTFRSKIQNITLTKFKIEKFGTYAFENGKLYDAALQGKTGSQVLWTELRIDEKTLIKVYNCHFQLKRLSQKDRLMVLDFVLNDAKKFAGPVVICGDMNTYNKASQRITRFLLHRFNKYPKGSSPKGSIIDETGSFLELASSFGFKEVIDLKDSTWTIPFTNFALFKLKLDWIFVRGFEHAEYLMLDALGDHRPIVARLYLS